MFCYKIHKINKEIVLAVCDLDLVGKKFEQGKLQLDVKKDFYYDKKIDKDVIKLFGKATIINLVGKKIITLAIKNKWIEKENVIKIKGIPHAQIIKMR